MAAADGKLRETTIVSDWKQAWNQFNNQNREEIQIVRTKRFFSGVYAFYMHSIIILCESNMNMKVTLSEIQIKI